MILSSKFQTISWKFLALLFPAVTLAAIVFLLLYAITKHQSLEVNLLNKIEEISKVHSLSVAHPLWTLDFEGLERSIQTIALHPEIECVEVLELSDQRNLFYTSEPFIAALKREILTGALFFFLLVSVAGVVAFAALQTIVGRPVQL